MEVVHVEVDDLSLEAGVVMTYERFHMFLGLPPPPLLGVEPQGIPYSPHLTRQDLVPVPDL